MNFKELKDFIKAVFTPNNQFKDDIMTPNPSKWNCTFCPYKNKKELCNVGIS